MNWNERIKIPIQSYQRQRCSSNVKKTLSRELVKRASSRDKRLVMIPVCSFFDEPSLVTNFLQNSSHHVLLDRPTLAEETLLEWVIRRS